MTLDGVNFWAEILEALSLKLKNPLLRQWNNITTATYNIKTATLQIKAPNKFMQEQMLGYSSELKNIVREIMFQDAQILISLDENIKALEQKILNIEPVINKPVVKKNRSSFIPRFTFENFVVGSNNQFAHASCLSVAARPCKSYNPLFIFGSSGLGKTHLLHAIGNYISEYFNDVSVIYTNGERFLNEYVKALKTNTWDSFRKKFREDYDVILIDDIQFVACIAGKGKFQEELFHTISYAQDHNKQIVLASDKFPDEIEGLDKRLMTRFSSGLVCDIKIPELETRIAIIKNKAKELNINISNESCMKLAEILNGSVRELEGAVNSIGAYSSFANTPITPDFIEETYTKKLAVLNNSKKIDIETIINKVATYYNVNPKDIISSNRKQELVLPRHISMYIVKTFINKPVSEIAKIFKKKNHSTVLHAFEKIEELRKSDPRTQKDIDCILNEVKK